MKLWKLHIHWGCRCEEYERCLGESYHKTRELEKRLHSSEQLGLDHDREVLKTFLEENVKDELEALSQGLDRNWRKSEQ